MGHGIFFFRSTVINTPLDLRRLLHLLPARDLQGRKPPPPEGQVPHLPRLRVDHVPRPRLHPEGPSRR